MQVAAAVLHKAQPQAVALAVVAQVLLAQVQQHREQPILAAGAVEQETAQTAHQFMEAQAAQA